MDGHGHSPQDSSQALSAPRSVAIVTAVVPEPRDSGKKVMIAGLLDYWSRRVGAEHVHLVLVGGPDELPELGVPVHRVARPRAARQALSVLTRSVLTRRHTLQESALYSADVRRSIAAVLEEVRVDLEIFDTVRMGQYAEEVPPRAGVRRVVFLDDLFSVRYQRMLALMREHPEVQLDALGDFRANLPGPVGRLVDRPAVRRALLGWERSVVAKREDQLARSFDTSLLVSPEEAHRLAARVPGARVQELRPAIDVRPGERTADPSRPTFVLLGLLTLPHNADGVQTFLDECLPGLLRALPDARVHVIGRGASPALTEQLASYGDSVRLEGYVEDLDALLNSATALVMPLRFGSGIKIKVIEALARGLPVLSSPVGAEGLETGEERGVLVESDLSRYGVVLADLVDPERNRALSAAARQHYETKYAPVSAFRSYDVAFDVCRHGEPG